MDKCWDNFKPQFDLLLADHCSQVERLEGQLRDVRNQLDQERGSRSGDVWAEPLAKKARTREDGGAFEREVKRADELEKRLAECRQELGKSKMLTEYYVSLNEGHVKESALIRKQTAHLKSLAEAARQCPRCLVAKVDALSGPDEPMETTPTPAAPEPISARRPRKESNESTSEAVFSPSLSVDQEKSGRGSSLPDVVWDLFPLKFEGIALNCISFGDYVVKDCKRVQIDSKVLTMFNVPLNPFGFKPLPVTFHISLALHEMQEVRFHFVANNVNIRVVVCPILGLKLRKVLNLNNEQGARFDPSLPGIGENRMIKYITAQLSLTTASRQDFVGSVVNAWNLQLPLRSNASGEHADDQYIKLSKK